MKISPPDVYGSAEISKNRSNLLTSTRTTSISTSWTAAVPILTLSPFFVGGGCATKPLDCHLMVTRPQDYISQLAQAGADFITLHPETINGQSFPPD